MSEIVSTLYITPYFTYGSPRYNCVRTLPTVLVPEDYKAFDNLNGTCDKYFPCYTLTTNTPPKTELINNEGVTTMLKGSFSFREHRTSTDYSIIGRKSNPGSPYNLGLARHKVYLTKCLTAKLNPGWCVLQTRIKPPQDEEGKDTYIPQFVVRILGNNDTIKQLYAVDLDEETTQNIYGSQTDFLPGEIIKYKQNLFKCIIQTKDYPPITPTTNNNWQYLNLNKSIFNADLFAISDNNAEYFLSVEEDKRKFNPTTDDPDTLVAWNAAYYHS